MSGNISSRPAVSMSLSMSLGTSPQQQRSSTSHTSPSSIPLLLSPLTYHNSNIYPNAVTPPACNFIQVHHHYHTPPGYSSWLAESPPRASSAPPIIEDLPPLADTPPRIEAPALDATCHHCLHRREKVYPCHRTNPPPITKQMSRCTLKFCDNCLKQLIVKSYHVLLPSIAAANGWKAYYESRSDDDWCCPRCHLFCDCNRCMAVKLPEQFIDEPLKASKKRQHILFDDNEKMNTTPTVKVRRHAKVERP